MSQGIGLTVSGSLFVGGGSGAITTHGCWEPLGNSLGNRQSDCHVPNPIPLSSPPKVSAAMLLEGWVLLAISALLLLAWALAPRRLYPWRGSATTSMVQAAAGRSWR